MSDEDGHGFQGVLPEGASPHAGSGVYQRGLIWNKPEKRSSGLISPESQRDSATQVRLSQDVSFSGSRGTGFQRFQPVMELMIPCCPDRMEACATSSESLRGGHQPVAA
jgi:hypothetical protein